MLPPGVQPLAEGDPSRIGPFQLIGRLGAGGMGVVYAGLTADGARVAVKQIRSEYAGDPEFRSRFAREVALMARVTGPCLVPLLSADPAAERPWLATPYIPGPTLGQHLAQFGPLTGSQLVALAAGTAAALAAVHAAGVVHRDLKPANVILAPDGPRILDFGIAHAAEATSITRTGVYTGTPGWTSPEQYQGEPGGPAGDVFCWGALLALASTGREPFGGGRPDAVAYRILKGEPDLDGVPEMLAPHVIAALSKDPRDRPPASGLTEHLRPLLAAQQTAVLQTAGTLVLPDATDVDAAVRGVWQPPPGAADAPWSAPRAGRGKLYTGVALMAIAAVGVIMFALQPGTTSAAQGRHSTLPAPSSTNSTSPTVTPTPVTAPSVAAVTGPTKIVFPAVFEGLAQDQSSSVVRSMQGKANADFSSAPGTTQAVTGYSTAVGDRLPKLLVIGASGDVSSPTTQLAAAWSSLAAGGNTVTQKTAVDPGPLGGEMQCALVTESGVYFPTCLWADDTTLAIVMDTTHLYDAAPDLGTVAATTRSLRAAAEVPQ